MGGVQEIMGCGKAGMVPAPESAPDPMVDTGTGMPVPCNHDQSADKLSGYC